jgi:carboxyl-terminal processing protease
MNSMAKKTFGILLLVGIAFYGGLYVGNNNHVIAGTTSNSGHVSVTDQDFSLYWKALSILENKHPDANEITSEERIWGSISGLADSYNDPYTSFFNPEQTSMFEESINGEFSGVGMEVGIRDGYIAVIAPIKDSPAERAGLLPGDVIIRIDGESSLEMSLDSAVEKIRGPKGEPVVLTISREGENDLLDIEIIRDVIEVPTVEIQELETGEYVINLYSFGDKSAEDFGEALKEFADSSSRELILDLRNNPGGYLDASVDVASWFIPEGRIVVTEEFSKDSGRQDIAYRSKGYEINLPRNLEMVVLVNEGSASASEIVAGALQEYEIAEVVGTKTFGKGSVQEYVRLNRDTALKVTVARWLTPLGNSISNDGLTPDVEVEQDVEIEGDEQLQAALELLN